MRTSYFILCLTLSLFAITTTTSAQTTVNFEETWNEFLDNNKISNISQLVRPNKMYEQPRYAKYLLMNANSALCQGELERAESLMAELREMNPAVHKSVPGFVQRMEEVTSKIDAYHGMDGLWNRYLRTKEVSLDELEAVEGAKISCEKSTLAKYSFLTAYGHFCRGDIAQAKDIFENRTLKLIEKTTFRAEEVEGLPAEVAAMKALYRDLDKLETAWRSYVSTGVSPGFDIELPLFSCYPIPNMKALVLNGALDICNAAPAALEEILQLQAAAGVAPTGELKTQIAELEAAVEQTDSGLAVLNEAWEAFIPDNEVRHWGKYGYEYCSTEPLIKAYIMDGFADVCGLGEDMLREINRLLDAETVDLEEMTMIKINELAMMNEEHRINGDKIEQLWTQFVAQGDTLYRGYESAEFYCDNIHKVKDWTIQGFSSGCEGQSYLDRIDRFQETFEFNFTEEVECRVQRLRIRLWECRYRIVERIARLEAPDAFEARLAELMDEYGMSERPEACELDE